MCPALRRRHRQCSQYPCAAAEVETDVIWSAVGYRCTCCSLPPRPLDDQQRDVLACSQFKPRRRKRRHSGCEVLQGTWALEPSFSSIAQQFMHRLTFIGDRCIDALGQRWKITDDGGTLYLIKGRIWVSGGVLFREGKSGIVMRFQREEEYQVLRDVPCQFQVWITTRVIGVLFLPVR
ncbi:PDIL2-1 [Symbiodinium natans]|uniref:PDIL2-1 protein n=1 Tax=Symbiodinium natans TaxID=878477 RepID=A0A812NTR6_9DINO|nr:PDIL2-1 [Symbiodinium natans]